MRYEEKICIDALVHCLKDQCGCRQVTVEEPTHDPPDSWLTVDGERFAVEVTSIVKGQDYLAACDKLRRLIRDAAEKQGPVSGTYALRIQGCPRLPKSRSRDWRDLVSRATSFIQTTRDADSPLDLLLLDGMDGRVIISKADREGAVVGATGPTSAKYQGQIEAELRDLMPSSITKKRQALEKQGVPPPIILLLHDAYWYAEPEDAHRALLRVDGFDWFHSVFWVDPFTHRTNVLFPGLPGRIGSFLYSANKNWMSTAPMTP